MTSILKHEPTVASSSAPASPVNDTNGVLLYYKYVHLGFPLNQVPSQKKNGHQTHLPCSEKQQAVADFYQSNCEALNLKGRIRVGEDGVNVCIGGSMLNLHAHIQAMIDHPVLQGGDIDFKLSVSAGAQNDTCLRESGMNKLAITMKKELCTLGVSFDEENPAGGVHLTPAEFHAALGPRTSAVGGESAEAEPQKESVLIDCRNIYESNIGHFESDSCELLIPNTRQFSDFPRWVDDNAARLEGKRILMYCTGGVRCERASSLIMQRGEKFADVSQLKGGIQRYLEAYRYADGGRFKGRNFVFDERVTMGSTEGEGEGDGDGAAAAVANSHGYAHGHVSNQENCVGKCAVCACSYSEYDRRARCCRCRMLVLVCAACDDSNLLCELCEEKDKKQQQQESFAKDQALQKAEEQQQRSGRKGKREHVSRIRRNGVPGRLSVLCVLSTPPIPPLPNSAKVTAAPTDSRNKPMIQGGEAGEDGDSVSPLVQAVRRLKLHNHAVGKAVKDLKIQMQWNGVDIHVVNVGADIGGDWDGGEGEGEGTNPAEGASAGADENKAVFQSGCSVVNKELARAISNGQPYDGIWGVFAGGCAFLQKYMLLQSQGQSGVVADHSEQQQQQQQNLRFVLFSQEGKEGTTATASSAATVDKYTLSDNSVLPVLRVLLPQDYLKNITVAGVSSHPHITGVPVPVAVAVDAPVPHLEQYIDFMQTAINN